MSKQCSKCAKLVLTEGEITDRLKACYCGIVGARLFRRMFPEYGNLPPVSARRVRTRRPRAAW